MPDSRHPTREVNEVYDQLEVLIQKARNQGRWLVIGGDFNAVVGDMIHGKHRQVGPHGIGTRNTRGQSLANWISKVNLCIANTQFKKTLEKQWTHIKNDVKRQIDYGIISCKVRKWLINSEACDDISVGAEHRAVSWLMRIPMRAPRDNEELQRTTKPKKPQWKHTNEKKFETQIKAQVASLQTEGWNTLRSAEENAKPLMNCC